MAGNGKCDVGRILVTDDEAVIRKLFTTILSFAFPGVTIDAACNGLEAVDLFQQGHHGVLLMDLRMPEMDGREAFFAIENLCRSNGWQMPAVIFCTGFNPPEAVASIVADGRHALLNKPVSSDMLIEQIRKKRELVQGEA